MGEGGGLGGPGWVGGLSLRVGPSAPRPPSPHRHAFSQQMLWYMQCTCINEFVYGNAVKGVFFSLGGLGIFGLLMLSFLRAAFSSPGYAPNTPEWRVRPADDEEPDNREAEEAPQARGGGNWAQKWREHGGGLWRAMAPPPPHKVKNFRPTVISFGYEIMFSKMAPNLLFLWCKKYFFASKMQASVAQKKLGVNLF